MHRHFVDIVWNRTKKSCT